jgi:hypothetical protein
MNSVAGTGMVIKISVRCYICNFTTLTASITVKVLVRLQSKFTLLRKQKFKS